MTVCPLLARLGRPNRQESACVTRLTAPEDFPPQSLVEVLPPGPMGTSQAVLQCPKVRSGYPRSYTRHSAAGSMAGTPSPRSCYITTQLPASTQRSRTPFVILSAAFNLPYSWERAFRTAWQHRQTGERLPEPPDRASRPSPHNPLWKY